MFISNIQYYTHDSSGFYLDPVYPGCDMMLEDTGPNLCLVV